MTSLLTMLAEAVTRPTKTPLPFVRKSRGLSIFERDGADKEAQMAQMGAVGTLFQIVHRTSNSTSLVEWKLWEKAASGKKEDRKEVTDHPALNLWNRPNRFYSRQEFVETEQQHVDLTGEGWWVIARSPMLDLPLELWPVRPDRMRPVKDPERFLAGYIYTSPDGEEIPLDVRDVIMLRMPNPLDPYRGMGPVQAIMSDLYGVASMSAWQRNFFQNSAQPGGVIEIEENLTDDEWREMTARWEEQHQGVAQAHRVAIIERGGKWVDRKFSMRDLMFPELRSATRDVIRDAFGYPKFMGGEVTDVNRANANASADLYAKHLTIPRLERFKGALNNDLLPQYGPSAANLEFDYEDPTPEDAESRDRERGSQAQAATALVGAGFDSADVLKWAGMPAMRYERPAAPAPFGGGEPSPSAPKEDPVAALYRTTREAWGLERLAALPSAPPRNEDAGGGFDPSDIDLGPVQEQWESEHAALVGDWSEVTQDQRAQLAEQIDDAVSNGDLVALAALTVTSAAGAALLLAAMLRLASAAGAQMVVEAAAQGVTITAASVQRHGLEVVAQATASLLGEGLAQAAGREALRLYRPGVDTAEVLDGVREHLDGLSDAYLRDQLGGALTRAQNLGRLETLRGAPVAAYYASEILDNNTCKPCRDIDGTRLPDLMAALLAYGGGPYWGCEGGVRCRGTMVAVWEAAP